MTATKTTVTHPDGTVSVRSSRTRAYTHAVEVTPAPAAKAAAYLTRRADQLTAKAAAYRAAADNGKISIVSRGFKTVDPLIGYQATLAGTDRHIYTWSTADGQTCDILAKDQGIVPVTTYLPAYARRMADVYDAEAAQHRAEAAAIAAAGTPVGTYGVLRWSSRPDLAAKALSEFDHWTDRGHSLRVVKVDR